MIIFSTFLTKTGSLHIGVKVKDVKKAIIKKNSVRRMCEVYPEEPSDTDTDTGLVPTGEYLR